MNGSFEASNAFQVVTSTLSTGVQRTGWSYVSGAATLVNNTIIVRSGGNSLDLSTSSSTNYTVSPTAPTTAVGSATAYVVQFYAWKNNTGTARLLNVSVTPDVTFGTSVASASVVGTTGSASTSWGKYTFLVTSGAGTATPRYGSVKIAGSGGSFANVILDDFCMYAGTAVDATAPDSPIAAYAVSGTSTNTTISWTAPSTGVDGGGYLVVRFPSNPGLNVDPNLNGIYSVGNTIYSNATTRVANASLDGIVVYSGTDTTYNDTNATAGCYYKIYTLDKAFNYSNEITTSLPGAPASLTGTATATAFTTTYGTASAVQSFNVSGNGLTNNIVATAPTGYEVSSDGTSYGSTATVTYDTNTGLASGIIRLRLAATASVSGSYNSKTVSLECSPLTTLYITTAATGNSVAAKALTITGLTGGVSRAYNGTTIATYTGTAAYAGGFANGESYPTVTGTPVGNFATAAVGSSKAITITGYTAPTTNYSVTQPTGLTGIITKAPLTITANNQSVTFGTAATAVTSSGSYSASGLAPGETIANLGGTVAYSTTYTSTTAAGTAGVTITPSGLSSRRSNSLREF